MIKRLRRWTLRLTITLSVLLMVAIGGIWLALRASLPQLQGSASLSGLQALVTVKRDALGTVSLYGKGSTDLAIALGFVHAQERYFEMDLSRRRAAGELAELFGAAALPMDRASRVHRFRARADIAIATLPDHQRLLLEGYSIGVNAGLDALGARPFAYLLLRQQPKAWSPADSLLVGDAMYLMLQASGIEAEARKIELRRQLPDSVVRFLLRSGTDWDAALDGRLADQPALPLIADFDARQQSAESYEVEPNSRNGDQLSVQLAPRIDASDADRSEWGSNSFAIGGALSSHGSAILANDMHLGHGVPNIWFRACLHDSQSSLEQVCGVSLPGLPGIVSGSNGQIAWGFTNSYGDWFDFVEIALNPDLPGHYLHAQGSLPFTVHRETIAVRGAESAVLEVRESVWGPLIEPSTEDAKLAPMALRWVAHLPGAMNLGLNDLAGAESVQQALAIAPTIGMPAQNLLVVDRQGRLAWTVLGPLPKRTFQSDPAMSIGAPAPETIWDGWRAAEQRPSLIDPSDQRLWTANNRLASADQLSVLGDGGYDLGARARQIRDRLRIREQFSESDLRAIQLDSEAVFLERWWHLLNANLDALDDDRQQAAKSVLVRWNRNAGVDSVAYRLVRAFRLAVHERILAPYKIALREHNPSAEWPRMPQAEGAIWQTLQTEPFHLLGKPWDSYTDLLSEAAAAAIDELRSGGEDLAKRSWGERNTSAIGHPLSRAVPLLGYWLDMPAQALPGDSNMPRVQGPAFGASERMVVAPGREQHGLLHMPGGQSGHPLSPFYGSGHSDWAEGRATPFLPGAVEYELLLESGLR